MTFLQIVTRGEKIRESLFTFEIRNTDLPSILRFCSKFLIPFGFEIFVKMSLPEIYFIEIHDNEFTYLESRDFLVHSSLLLSLLFPHNVQLEICT